MKKQILSVFMTIFVIFTAIGIPPEKSVSADETVTYTVQDIRNLQDFLLNRPTSENLAGKPYDLDNDNRWTVFDLCLMKRACLSEKNTTHQPEFDLEKGTVMLNSGYEMPILGIGTYCCPLLRQKTLFTGHCMTAIGLLIQREFTAMKQVSARASKGRLMKASVPEKKFSSRQRCGHLISTTAMQLSRLR